LAVVETATEAVLISNRMPVGAPENVLRMLPSSKEGTPKLDLSATWTNEFVEAP
jgi:hypothetical protein